MDKHSKEQIKQLSKELFRISQLSSQEYFDEVKEYYKNTGQAQEYAPEIQLGAIQAVSKRLIYWLDKAGLADANTN